MNSVILNPKNGRLKRLNKLVVNAGKAGLVIWAVTLAGLLGGGALLVYKTSALGS